MLLHDDNSELKQSPLKTKKAYIPYHERRKQRKDGNFFKNEFNFRGVTMFVR